MWCQTTLKYLAGRHNTMSPVSGWKITYMVMSSWIHLTYHEPHVSGSLGFNEGCIVAPDHKFLPLRHLRILLEYSKGLISPANRCILLDSFSYTWLTIDQKLSHCKVMYATFGTRPSQNHNQQKNKQLHDIYHSIYHIINQHIVIPKQYLQHNQQHNINLKVLLTIFILTF